MLEDPREPTVTLGADVRLPAEIAWAQNRPFEHRVPMPAVGDYVLYRSNDWAMPIMVIVVDVDVEDEEPGYRGHLLPEPWPMIKVMVHPAWPLDKLDASGKPRPGAAGPRPYAVRTMEARLSGAAGWLPLDWERRFYPPMGPGAFLR